MQIMLEIHAITEKQKLYAKKIHDEAIIVDGLTYMSKPPETADYLHRLIDSGITASNFTIPYATDTFTQTIYKISEWYTSLNKFSDIFTLIRTADDIRNAKKENKTGIIMGFQEPLPLESNLELVEVFYNLGVRIIQLTYQFRNSVGGSCAQQDNDAGLTGFGQEFVRKLNDIGILVDLSHVGPKTAMDALEYSNKPVVVSHAGVMSLKKHVRNVSDELIKALAKKGGLIGLPSYTQFLGLQDHYKGTLTDYLDVIDYIVKITGTDNVGIAFDFCPSWVPEDHENAQKLYPEIYLDLDYHQSRLEGLTSVEHCINVTEGLVNRGYSDDDITKILGGNFMRVFDNVWQK